MLLHDININTNTNTYTYIHMYVYIFATHFNQQPRNNVTDNSSGKNCRMPVHDKE